MSLRSARRKRWVVAALMSLGIGAVWLTPGFGPRRAEAVIGRPLTPMSYAGVARRTVRRSTYYHAYYYR
jgi:hypothetical protein